MGFAYHTAHTHVVVTDTPVYPYVRVFEINPSSLYGSACDPRNAQFRLTGFTKAGSPANVYFLDGNEPGLAIYQGITRSGDALYSAEVANPIDYASVMITNPDWDGSLVLESGPCK